MTEQKTIRKCSYEDATPVGGNDMSCAFMSAALGIMLKATYRVVGVEKCGNQATVMKRK